ncbi:MAG: porin family protein [Alphaproteobacteria bacterium]|nr:porin family protein [Alphaproteobacteria bacterium]
MHLKSTLLASAALVVATVVPAQAGTYMSIFGGWNAVQDDIAASAGSAGTVDISLTETVVHNSGAVLAANHNHSLNYFVAGAVSTFVNSGAEAESGFLLGAAVGGNAMDWLRIEVEGSYRTGKLGPSSGSAFASGNDSASATFEAPGVGTGNITHSCLSTPQLVAGFIVIDPPPAPCVARATAAGVYAFTRTISTSDSQVANDGLVSSFTVMANAWADFDLGGIKPYIGGGIGYAFNQVNASRLLNGNDNDFAWQLGAGVNVALTEKWDLGVGYRYLDAGEITVRRLTLAEDAGFTYGVKHQSVQVNLTYQIPNE